MSDELAVLQGLIDLVAGLQKNVQDLTDSIRLMRTQASYDRQRIGDLEQDLHRVLSDLAGERGG